jgi:hypothetical protein
MPRIYDKGLGDIFADSLNDLVKSIKDYYKMLNLGFTIIVTKPVARVISIIVNLNSKRMTNQEADKAAEKLGFKDTGVLSHGQKVYKKTKGISLKM